MAEGPVVHFYARRLRKALKGKPVRIEFGIRKLKELEPTLQNLHVEEVDAHGKQLRIHLSDTRVLLVHLMMWGSWRVYRKGVEWDKPRNRARLILSTNEHEVVAFSAPVVRLLTHAELDSDARWSNLGPDPLRADFSSREFFHRLQQHPTREIGEVLLDQSVIAGLGNILRIEILFHSHLHPRRLVHTLCKQEKNELLRNVLLFPQQWLKEMGKKKSWMLIYRKSGQPCPRCRTTIEFFRQNNRITFACPSCQH